MGPNFLAISLVFVTSWTDAVMPSGVVVIRISVDSMLRLSDCGHIRLAEASIWVNFRRDAIWCLSLVSWVVLELRRLSTLRVAFIGFPTLWVGQWVTRLLRCLQVMSSLLTVAVNCPLSAAIRVGMPRECLVTGRLWHRMVRCVSVMSIAMICLWISASDVRTRHRLMPLARLCDATFPRMRLRLVSVPNLLTWVPMLRCAMCLWVVTDLRLIARSIVWQLVRMVLILLLLKLIFRLCRVLTIVSYSLCLVMIPCLGSYILCTVGEVQCAVSMPGMATGLLRSWRVVLPLYGCCGAWLVCGCRLMSGLVWVVLGISDWLAISPAVRFVFWPLRRGYFRSSEA